MKARLPALVILSALLNAGLSSGEESKALVPAEITATLKRVADWQLANPNRTDLRDWVIAPLYDGLIDTSETTGDPKYLAAVLRMGLQSGWEPGNRLYHADDQAVGHAWLDIYLMDPSHAERLKPFKERIDAILSNPVTEKLAMGKKAKTPGVEVGDRWTWCDALFMAPPTLARLAQATGDERYLKFLDGEYRATCDALFDPKENLFYRDARFIGQKTPNGAKVFWSRGNGWVFAGLPMLLDSLPADHPTRKFYVELFQKMAPVVLSTQQPDGLWYPSLADPKQIAMGETSGSAFFVYGLAWGVHHGLLDHDTFWPAVERGWKAVLTRVAADGAVGFVQKIGDSPGHLSADSRQLYGTGAVLMAGSEILRTLGAAAKTSPADLLGEAEKLAAADKTPRAYARLVPERKDDLAWENDKIAHRVYGPALRPGIEGSGIDAWAKSVSYPVLDKWYADDLAGRQSYHKNHGEGYDGFEVGDSRGCGGLGIWKNRHLIVADVYDDATIFWTAPDVAEFQTRYSYPPIDGKRYRETRVTRLRLGEHLNEITSRFTLDAPGNPPAANLEIAIGLITQTPKGEIILQPEAGRIAIWDFLQPGGERFGTGVVVSPGATALHQPPTKTSKREEALVIVRTDANGEIKYRMGFGWAGDGETTSKEAWLRLLEKSPSNAQN